MNDRATGFGGSEGSGGFDIGPLVWVKSEIDQALSRARQAFQSYVTGLSGVSSGAGDTTQIRFCRTHLHQVKGALTIVGLDGIKQFTEALESLLEMIEQQPPESGKSEKKPPIPLVLSSIDSIGHYLDDLLAGQPDQPLRLFPIYEQIQQARGLEHVSPTELFFPNLDVQLPRQSPLPLQTVSPEIFQQLLRQERSQFQRGFLSWLKNPEDLDGVNEMLKSVQRIEATQETSASRAFWWIAGSLLSAIVEGALSENFDIKQLCARIDLQIRRLSEGSKNVAERLMRDLLYFVATTESPNDAIQQVRDIYRPQALIPEESLVSTTPREIIRRKLREVIEITGEAWNTVCAESAHSAHSVPSASSISSGSFGLAPSLQVFSQHARLLASTADPLGQVDFRRLAQGIVSVANWLETPETDVSRLSDALAMETATAILLAQNAQKNFQALGSDFAHQVDIAVARIQGCIAGRPPDESAGCATLDEISSKAQEKLLINQVAKEIKINLAQVEHVLDDFFRDAGKRAELETLDVPVRQIAGALTMLRHDEAAAALDKCLNEIRRFARPDYIPDGTDFERIASHLSVIGLFIDSIPHGSADFTSFVQKIQLEQFQLASASARKADKTPQVSFEQEIAQKKTEIHSLLGDFREEPDDLALKETLRQNLDALQKDADLIDDTALGGQVEALKAMLSAETVDAGRIDAAIDAFRPPSKELPPEPSAETRELSQASDETIDAELLDIFLQEAREVLATVEEKLAALKSMPADSELLMTIRRSFHTLKGSGRMVGLKDFGEAAWAVEQTLNLWLRRELEVTPPLFDLIGQAYLVFSEWVDHLAGVSAHLPDASEMIALAHSLRDAEESDVLAMEERAARMEQIEQSAPELRQSSRQSSPQNLAPPAVPIAPIASIPPLEISPELRAIFFQESVAHLEALSNGVYELEQNEGLRTPDEMYRAAHTLAGISAAVGFGALNHLARTLQDALARRENSAQRGSLEAIGLMRQALDEIDQMLCYFDSGREVVLPADLIEALEALYPVRPEKTPESPETAAEGSEAQTARPSRAVPLVDEIDEQLLPVFLEEFADLSSEICEQLHLWRENPDDAETVRRLARLLHTLKGSARMAGAMNIGQLTHTLESGVEKTLHSHPVSAEIVDEVNEDFDEILRIVESLQRGEVPEAAPARPKTPAPETLAASSAIQSFQPSQSSQLSAPPASPEAREPCVSSTSDTSQASDAPDASDSDAAQRQATLRVHAALVDRLVSEACELSITRAQIESEMRGIKDSLIDLTENVTRLRRYLRDIHVQAESRMPSGAAQPVASHHKSGTFDPLEFDRFTRFQELTRMMAESVNDVGNVQQNLLKNLDSVNSALLVQSRLNKEIQWDLVTIRMLPFGTIKDRLYRIVRRTSKELGKRVNLEIRGEQVELDRSVLDKMIPPLEHLLRNAIAHGIEDRDTRRARGKPEIGEISLSLKQESNEIILHFLDDGAGLDFERIRHHALETGLLKPDEDADKSRLAKLIFLPGFSTASEVSQIAGRGVGMDVVKTEVASLGGRIETRSEAGKGTEFRITLPLTMAVSQILLLRVGKKNYAVPSPMVEQVLDLKESALAKIHQDGCVEWMGGRYPCHYLPRLLGDTRTQPEQKPPTSSSRIVLLRNGMRCLSLEVDEVIGSREIIVKNIGPQLARVAGLDGATVLANGQVVLILNPIALSECAHCTSHTSPTPDALPLDEAPPEMGRMAETAQSGPPTIMVVDDSLTIRKIADRLLSRNGYQTLLARDGFEAMELLIERVPDVMLIDIEMPRMDGFELTRAIRASKSLKDVPIIMITSRTADKHRNYAFEIGVNHFLGKPFQEEEVLKLVAHHVERRMAKPAGT